jgi:hypothetical protein
MSCTPDSASALNVATSSHRFVCNVSDPSEEMILIVPTAEPRCAVKRPRSPAPQPGQLRKTRKNEYRLQLTKTGDGVGRAVKGSIKGVVKRNFSPSAGSRWKMRRTTSPCRLMGFLRRPVAGAERAYNARSGGELFNPKERSHKFVSTAGRC